MNDHKINQSGGERCVNGALGTCTRERYWREAKTFMCCIRTIMVNLSIIIINQNIVYNLYHMPGRYLIYFHNSCC